MIDCKQEEIGEKKRWRKKRKEKMMLMNLEEKKKKRRREKEEGAKRKRGIGVQRGHVLGGPFSVKKNAEYAEINMKLTLTYVKN